MTTIPAERVLDPSIPLCFDTNVLYHPRAARKFLERIRASFPTRDLVLPVWVIAEKTRQLRQEHGEGYNRHLISNFLDDEDLRLRIVAFDREVAMTHWLDAVSLYTNEVWQQRERCRFADHGIYASARALSAILVTGDGELRERVMADNYVPGTITADELRNVL